MCQRIGRPPISTIGFGLKSVSSRKRVPRPPARIATFIGESSSSTSGSTDKVGALSSRAFPEKVFVNLIRAKKMFQLLQPCESGRLKQLFSHADVREHIMQLRGAPFGVPVASESRQDRVDLVEGNAVAPVNTSARAECERA